MSKEVEYKEGFLYWLYWLVKKYPWSQRLHVLFDYLSLYRKKGLNFSEYYNFEFEKRDDHFRKSFLGKNEERFYVDTLNPKKYYILSRNKYLSHRVLEDSGVRVPILYCYYQPEGRFLKSDDCAHDYVSVRRILKDKNVSSCVVKSAESAHGEGVWVVTSLDYNYPDDVLLKGYDGQQKFLSEILKDHDLLFESVVKQSKQFATLNDSSINTIRFMTTLYPDGEARIIAIWFKVGRSGRCVDNAGSGGNVDGSIDIETGEIINVYQFDGWRRAKRIKRHPDTNAELEGLHIDNWETIKSEVLRFQQAFPYCKAAGWDIAITDDGPLVIEVNDLWDTTGQFFIGKGWRDEIRDCYLAWILTGKDYSLRRWNNELNDSHLNRIASR